MVPGCRRLIPRLVPWSQHWRRVLRIGFLGGIFVYNEQDEELNCGLFPWVTEVNNNAFADLNSSTNNIKRIVLKEGYLVDLLSFIVCPDGYKLIKGRAKISFKALNNPSSENYYFRTKLFSNST